MDTPKCESTFTTDMGKLLVVDDGLPRNQSIEYCKERSGVLAPLHNQEIVDEVSSKLIACVDENNVRRERDYLFYVGLRTINGQGNWSDNTEYDESIHYEVFKPEDIPTMTHTSKKWNCQIYYLNRSHRHLIDSGCELDFSTWPFLCMGAHPPTGAALFSRGGTLNFLIIVFVVVALVFGYMKTPSMNNKVLGVSNEIEDDDNEADD